LLDATRPLEEVAAAIRQAVKAALEHRDES
jgi:hypothetical protein